MTNNDPAKEEIAKLYEFGFSQNELAEMSGLGRTTIRTWLKEMGVKSRSRGYRNVPTLEEYREIIRLRDEEFKPWRMIGEEIGLTLHGARCRYKRAKEILGG